MTPQKGIRVALVGTESFRGKEMKNVLENRNFPSEYVDFFDPDVEAEYSKLTEFRGEPRVVLPVNPTMIAGSDVVFLASDKKTDREIGNTAAKNKFLAIDLNETFNANTRVPVVVAGVNHREVLEKRPSLIANPHPVTIILVHFLNVLLRKFKLLKIVAFVLQPVSAFSDPGIQELAEQSFAVLSSASVTKKFFKDQVAFNLLSDTGPVDKQGFSSTEKQILSETGHVLGSRDLPLSLAIVQAPVFHTYAIMIHLELDGRADIAALADLFKKSANFKVAPSSSPGSVSSLQVAGKEEIFVGRIKKETAVPDKYWIWTVTDNLTRGSALNAYEILENFDPGVIKKR
jgi:aspartate-semialdehyde dehydrogenase